MNNSFYFAFYFAKATKNTKATKNRYFSSLLCIIVLAVAPACNKKKARSEKEDVKTMIELDDEIWQVNVEVEEDLSDQKAIKF